MFGASAGIFLSCFYYYFLTLFYAIFWFSVLESSPGDTGLFGESWRMFCVGPYSLAYVFFPFCLFKSFGSIDGSTCPGNTARSYGAFGLSYSYGKPPRLCGWCFSIMLRTSSLVFPVAKPPYDIESELVVALVLFALLKLLTPWPDVIEANSSAAWLIKSRFWYDDPGLFE